MALIVDQQFVKAQVAEAFAILANMSYATPDPRQEEGICRAMRHLDLIQAHLDGREAVDAFMDGVRETVARGSLFAEVDG